MTLRAHETSLLAIVRAAVHMFLNTLGQYKPALHRLRLDEAIKVNPLSAIKRPGLPAERLANSLREDSLLKWSEVLTGHADSETWGRPAQGATERLRGSCLMRNSLPVAPVQPFVGRQPADKPKRHGTN